MGDFDEFWADKRIPPEMKRCGKPPVRKALAKTLATHEEILASLPNYAASKPSDQLFCHLSTYINAERYDIDHVAMSNAGEKSYDQRVHEADLFYLVKYGDWTGAVNTKPTVEEARVELHRQGWPNMEPDNVVKIKNGRR